MRKILFLCIATLFIFSSCKKDEVDQKALDDEIIQKYIADHSYTASKTSSGLYYVIDVQGAGSYPTADSTVTVAYVGKLSNGGVFDQSNSLGATFPLANVIQGWKEGIPYYSEGGEGVLLIPSHLGYGASGSASIPANSVLIFEIVLIDVQ
jgi:FKBP-type peptidyl-prolyl cis-trans isomerase FkpA